MQLREHLHQFDKQGDVEHIRHVVDADIALSSRAYQCLHTHAHKLKWFHHVDNSVCSVVANMFATTARIEQMLSLDGRALTQRLAVLPLHIQTWEDFCSYIQDDYAEVLSAPRDNLANYNVVKSLYELPQIRYWLGDSLPYFSLATLFSRALSTTAINAGIYRLAVHGPRTLTVNWRPGSRAHATWQAYATRAQRMPVTVAMGVDPALTFASLFPLPAFGSELSFWGFIRAQRQQVSSNRADLPLPREAEILLQGYIEPAQFLHEGSYANHTGFYTRSILCPIIQIEQIHMRPNAIVPITVVGPPPTESALLGVHVWKLLAVLLRRECPFILELMCPLETSHLPVIIVQVTTPSTAQMWECWRNSILNHPILGRVHTLIMVDETTDSADFRQVYWHSMNQELECYISPRSDLRVVDGVRWRFSGQKKVVLPFGALKPSFKDEIL